MALAVASLALGSACAAVVPLGLPAAPPPRSAEALARWHVPPPLAPDENTHLEWGVARRRLRSGLGVSAVSRPDSTTTAVLLWVPGAADASEGLVAVMAEALRAGTATRGGGLMVNPRIARQAI